MIQMRLQDSIKSRTQLLEQALYAVRWKCDEAAQIEEAGNQHSVNTAPTHE